MIPESEIHNAFSKKQYKVPEDYPRRNVRLLFLAGSIEMGAAELWQDTVARQLEDSVWTILNPRRDDWDSSWTQNIENEKFVQQVSWELRALEDAEKILLVFDPKTKSPISLLELGLFAKPNGLHDTKSSKLLVVCPDGFWRKGNVDVVCTRYNIPQFLSLGDAIKELKQY